jgi:hypothetical protein
VVTGVSGATLGYVAGTAIVRATPVLITHAEVVGWVAAAAGLLIAAAVTDLAKEWI